MKSQKIEVIQVDIPLPESKLLYTGIKVLMLGREGMTPEQNEAVIKFRDSLIYEKEMKP